MTNVTNLTPTATGAADLEPLVKQLARRADANRDGQVSSAEFAQFLSDQLTPATTSKTVPTSIETIHAAPTETSAAALLNVLAIMDMKEVDASAQPAKYRAASLAKAVEAGATRIVK